MERETFPTLIATTEMAHTASNMSTTCQPLISDNLRDLIALVNLVILSGTIDVFGSIANVINMIVFYKQGLNTPINISFFSLAVSDLCNVIIQQLYNVYINPLFVDLRLPMVYDQLQYITTSVNREAFARITCTITVFITAERCLCVVYPLRVKQIITPRITAVVIIAIFVFTLASLSPIFCTSYHTWEFYPALNRSLLGIAFNSENQLAADIVYLNHAIFTLLGFLSVLTFTLILIYKLGQKSAWRQTANVAQEKSKSMSKRDRSTITMVVLIACILIVCYAPAVFFCATTILEPEFSVTGRHYNVFYVCWTFAKLLEDINSSINVFLYYKMSSKYRHTFQELFSSCHRPDKKDIAVVLTPTLAAT